MPGRRDLIQSAEKLVARGKLQAAVKEYRKILDRSPSDTTTLNRLGDLYARLDRVDEAVSLFRQIAQHYSRDGFFVKAIAIFKKILRLDPTQFDIYETLAELYHRQGLVSEARAQYEVVADYFKKHGDTDGAIRIHRKMTELEPERLTHRVRLAELYEAEDQPGEALAQYRRIADLMLEHDRLDDAKKVFLRALDVGGEDLGFVTATVMALKDRGEVAAAEEILAAAVERNPQARRVRRLTGLADEADGAEQAARPRPPAAAPAPSDDDFEAAFDFVTEEIVAEAAGTGPAAEVAPEDRETEDRKTEDEAPEDEARQEAPAEEAPAEERPQEAPHEAPPPAALAAEQAAEKPPLEGELDLDLELEEPSWLDLDQLERSAEEVQPAQGEAEEDLLAEAEVFAKYGLEGRAEERLAQVLERWPRSLPALGQMVALRLRQESWQEVAELADRMRRTAQESGLSEEWRAVQRRLLDAGFSVEGDRVVAPAPAPPPEAETAPAPEPGAGPAAEPSPQPPAAEPVPESESIPEPAPELAPEPTPQPTPEPAPAPTPPAAAASDQRAPSAGAEGKSPAPPTEGAPAGADDVLDLLEDLEPAELDWLSEAGEQAAVGGHDAEVFDDEEQFFDLAAELERELEEDTPVPPAAPRDEDAAADPVREQTLEEIVEGFRKGVEESLSPKDYDTHYNLGIAYREMGLLDEAIGEFQLAAKDARYLVDCCSMLGLCFLDKGFPELAIKWYRRGLDSPAISEEETLGLLYELGNLHAAVGDSEAAYSTFVEIYGTNSNYRDVVARLEELGHRD